jgi:hypothetical protein
MAIKGKSKSRGAKTVAGGPKPAYVPVKTPLMRRRGLWIAVGAVLAVAVIFGLVVGFVQQRNEEREADRLARMTDVAGEYTGQVEPVLANLGQPLPPTSFDAFPSLATAMQALEADEVDEAALEDIGTAGSGVAESAENAATVLGQIDTTELLSGRNLPREFVDAVIASRDGFIRAMNLYRRVGELMATAAGAEESVRAELVPELRGFFDVAEEAFASAYTPYVEAQIAAEVFQPSLGGLTGAAGLSG